MICGLHDSIFTGPSRLLEHLLGQIGTNLCTFLCVPSTKFSREDSAGAVIYIYYVNGL